MQIRREREGVFKYDLLLKLESKDGRTIPKELMPKVGKAYEELF